MKIRLCLLAAALAAHLSPAAAADYDPPTVIDDAPEYQPVEVGSGWYLRGDVSYDLKHSYKDLDFAVPDPLAVSTSQSYDESRERIGADVGIGYHFTDYFRAELSAGYLGKTSFGMSGTSADACGGAETTTVTDYAVDGTPIVPSTITVDPAATRDCRAHSSASSSAWDGLASAYVDLGTYAGLTPYVGAGVGVIYTPVKIRAGDRTCRADSVTTGSVATGQTTNVTFLCDGQSSAADEDVAYDGTHYDDRKFSLTYGFSAGLSYRLSQNVAIDVGYRYLTAPDAAYVYSTGNGFGVAKGMDFQQVKVGLRYDLW